ncbi:MAG: HAMP domain-containing protein [Anaerolineales bacterium]|nr:HAMP domain-containing protein [Anaerolineales bacterium]
MNRLWVRLSIVIGLVTILVVLFPILERALSLMPDPPPRPAPPYPELPPESMQGLQSYFEGFFWQRTLTTLLVGGVIGVMAGILSSRWLTAPLNRLERAVQAITQRKLNTRVPEKGSHEVRSLARSFNQMAAELEAAETLRRNLLADVSHELRHPAHLLQGNLQAIQDGVYPLEMQEIERLTSQARHLTTLINDLYLLTQAEAQQLPLNCQKSELGELLKGAVEVFQTSAASSKVQLLLEIPEQPVLGEIDVMRMRQVLHNLLDNALRHTAAGGEVRLELEAQEGQARILISDTGEGISPDQIDHVFDRFYRGDSARSRSNSNGAGLGLAIAQAFVQAHGGEITVQSAPGQGATFTITLPVKQG